MQRKSAVQQRRRPVQERSRVTVDAILEGALQVLADEGIAGATTTRIAGRAGVSVGSLYQYFPDREALLAAVTERRLADFEAALRGAAAATVGRPAAERVRAMLTALVAAKAAELDASVALVPHLGELAVRERIAHFRAAVVELVRDLLAAAGVADAAAAAFVTVHAVDGALRGAMEEGGGRLRDPAFVDALTRLAVATLPPG